MEEFQPVPEISPTPQEILQQAKQAGMHARYGEQPTPEQLAEFSSSHQGLAFRAIETYLPLSTNKSVKGKVSLIRNFIEDKPDSKIVDMNVDGQFTLWAHKTGEISIKTAHGPDVEFIAPDVVKGVKKEILITAEGKLLNNNVHEQSSEPLSDEQSHALREILQLSGDYYEHFYERPNVFPPEVQQLRWNLKRDEKPPLMHRIMSGLFRMLPHEK